MLTIKKQSFLKCDRGHRTWTDFLERHGEGRMYTNLEHPVLGVPMGPVL
jgi:hypothetical protein